MIRRSLHEDLIQCSMVEPNHWVFQAIASQPDFAKTGRLRRQKEGS